MSTAFRGPLFATPLLDTPLWGAEGEASADYPGPGGNREVPMPRRYAPPVPEFDLTKLIEEIKPDKGRIIRVGGVGLFPEMVGEASARVVSVKVAAGEGVTQDMDGRAASGMILGMSGEGVMTDSLGRATVLVDSPDTVLGKLLGLEDLEDFR